MAQLSNCSDGAASLSGCELYDLNSPLGGPAGASLAIADTSIASLVVNARAGLQNLILPSKVGEARRTEPPARALKRQRTGMEMSAGASLFRSLRDGGLPPLCLFVYCSPARAGRPDVPHRDLCRRVLGGADQRPGHVSRRVAKGGLIVIKTS